MKRYVTGAVVLIVMIISTASRSSEAQERPPDDMFKPECALDNEWHIDYYDCGGLGEDCFAFLCDDGAWYFSFKKPA